MLGLLIGNKNYSSWSMRPWVVMRHFGIAFSERRLRLRSAELREVLEPLGATRTVPVLLDGVLAVQDSLAIAETLAERFPLQPLWPADPAQRARARSMCATMHAGFHSLRQCMPMNIEARLPGLGWSLAVQEDIDHVCRVWESALIGSGGPFLFGEFGIVDAFFAPVCTRFRTYAPSLPEFASAYVERVLAVPAVREWCEQACAEHDFMPQLEPYRSARA